MFVFGVSVSVGANPKVKVQEASHRMNTFRVPGNFRVGLECNPKVFLQGSLSPNEHFSGLAPLGLHNIESDSPGTRNHICWTCRVQDLVLPALYRGPVAKRGSTEKFEMRCAPEPSLRDWGTLITPRCKTNFHEVIQRTRKFGQRMLTP